MASDPPGADQMKDIDFLLAGGNLFALVVYAQLILEHAKLYEIDDDTIDQIVDFMIRDMAHHALTLSHQESCTDKQFECCQKILRKPQLNAARYDRVWKTIQSLDGVYQMNA